METGCDSGGASVVWRTKPSVLGTRYIKIQAGRKGRQTGACEFSITFGWVSRTGRTRGGHWRLFLCGTTGDFVASAVIFTRPEISSRNRGGSHDSRQAWRVLCVPGRPLLGHGLVSVRSDGPRPDTKWPSNRHARQVPERPRLRLCIHIWTVEWPRRLHRSECASHDHHVIERSIGRSDPTTMCEQAAPGD